MSLRLKAALAAVLLFSSAAHAGAAEELITAINKCAAITDDGMRHSCYDQLPTLVKSLVPVVAAAAPAPAALPAASPLAAPSSTAAPLAAPAPTASPLAATPPTASPPNQEKESGLFGLFESEPIPADHITATVESFTFDYGLFVVTLDSGQVWRQVAAHGDLVHLSRDHKDQVTIWRSPSGDYALRITGYHSTYHVRRIK